MKRRATTSAARRRRRVEPDAARARILEAAVAEFAARGYEAASTNAIAESAGVAKGLVFHHFANKVELYLEIIDGITRRLIDSFLAVPDWPADLFERLHAFSVHKVRVFQRDPQSYQVIAMMFDVPPPLRERVFAKAAELRAIVWPTMLRGVDASRLRPGLTLEAALDTVALLNEALERRIVARIRHLPDRGASLMNDLVREVWPHFERLRDGLYAR